MIHCRLHEEENWAELELDGRIDRSGFDAVAKELGAFMDQRGRIGILKHIRSFGGIAPSVLWDDLKFGFQHLKHCGPVAVVSEKRWIEVWTRLARPFWSSEVAFFEPQELEGAREWLAAAVQRDRAARPVGG